MGSSCLQDGETNPPDLNIQGSGSRSVARDANIIVGMQWVRHRSERQKTRCCCHRCRVEAIVAERGSATKPHTPEWASPGRGRCCQVARGGGHSSVASLCSLALVMEGSIGMGTGMARRCEEFPSRTSSAGGLEDAMVRRRGPVGDWGAWQWAQCHGGNRIVDLNRGGEGDRADWEGAVGGSGLAELEAWVGMGWEMGRGATGGKTTVCTRGAGTRGWVCSPSVKKDMGTGRSREGRRKILHVRFYYRPNLRLREPLE